MSLCSVTSVLFISYKIETLYGRVQCGIYSLDNFFSLNEHDQGRM